tara:strand:- start:69539 stop:69841 length:303 start_codon:yes stop_codon:yes gene_type:complete
LITSTSDLNDEKEIWFWGVNSMKLRVMTAVLTLLNIAINIFVVRSLLVYQSEMFEFSDETDTLISIFFFEKTIPSLAVISIATSILLYLVIKKRKSSNES